MHHAAASADRNRKRREKYSETETNAAGERVRFTLASSLQRCALQRHASVEPGLPWWATVARCGSCLFTQTRDADSEFNLLKTDRCANALHLRFSPGDWEYLILVFCIEVCKGVPRICLVIFSFKKFSNPLILTVKGRIWMDVYLWFNVRNQVSGPLSTGKSFPGHQWNPLPCAILFWNQLW